MKALDFSSSLLFASKISFSQLAKLVKPVPAKLVSTFSTSWVSSKSVDSLSFALNLSKYFSLSPSRGPKEGKTHTAESMIFPPSFSAAEILMFELSSQACLLRFLEDMKV